MGQGGAVALFVAEGEDGVAGGNAEEEAGHKASEEEPGDDADGYTGECEFDAVRKDQTEDLRRSGAEGHADTDFAGLQSDEIGHDGINANEREKKAESGEDPEKNRLRARRRVDLCNALLQGGDSGDGLILVDRPDAILQRGDQSKRIGVGIRANNQVRAEDTFGLEKRSVDLWL